MISFNPNDKKENYLNSIKNLETLFLDFDGTLVDYKQSQDKSLEILLQENNVPTDKIAEAIEFYKEVNDDLWNKFEKKEITIPEIRVIRFQKLMDKFNFTGQPLALNDTYIDNFIKNTELEDQYYNYLKKLKQLQVNVIIVTNGAELIQNKRVDKIAIRDLIDGMVTSEGTGFPKPDTQIFEIANTISKTNKENIWMVGDSFEADIVGANSYGIKSCYISSNGNLTHNSNVIPNITTSALYHFLELIIQVKS
ncbi:MAG: HAD-IA family hydrolase [Candidatus Heimdallarchaeota archaeon]|nr:HAD-IA family hydrolase [Candidatus Heimdallarchaeota archaeon]